MKYGMIMKYGLHDLLVLVLVHVILYYKIMKPKSNNCGDC